MTAEIFRLPCYPAQRSCRETISSQQQIIEQHFGPLKQICESLSEAVLIINNDRQIVFFNSAFLSLACPDDPGVIYGMRPGEALDCINSHIHPGGCGCSESCVQCGAVKSILAALSKKTGLQECRILRNDSLGALDLLVRSTPLQISDHGFIMVAITDISHQKRRRALERIFFHDVLNTARGIEMFAKMFDSNPEKERAESYRKHLIDGISQLIGQINSQKSLLSAENNELVPRREIFDGYGLVRQVAYSISTVFPEHKISIRPLGQKIILNNDKRLLRRVLENMILNALEAGSPEDEVTVFCRIKNNNAEFCVHNKVCIPENVRLQIFQRSFSTKGSGRGLGTYSMKLLSERYLNGTISFTSTSEGGTTFVASYPLIAT
jgi:signal transduction histidine kinase